MSEMLLTEWLASHPTRQLLRCLRQRQAGTLQAFQAGNPVEPMAQGRLAALHELERLLSGPTSDVERVFEAATKDGKP